MRIAGAFLFLILSVRLGAQATPEARTQQVLELWRSGKYNAIYAIFNDEMHKAISLDQYSQESEQVKAMGAIKIAGTPHTTKKGAYVVVNIPFEAGSTALDFLVSWDQNDRIAGTFIRILSVQLGAQATPEGRTQQVLELWRSGKYDAIYAMFNDEMRKAISLDQYAQGSEQVKAMGTIKITGEPKTTKKGAYVVVNIPFEAGTTALDLLVSWDQNDRIAGTFIRPGRQAAEWEPPAYVDRARFEAHDVTIGDDEWKLPGVLTLPKGKGPYPALVLVHGSGPNDRDESVEGIKVFKDLALGLSSRGVAVLRYDKRTKVYPQRFAATANFTMNEETVDDAVRAAAFLRTQASIDPARVFVLGHSQGGYMAPRIGKRDPKLAGLIVLAGNVRPLEDLILEQSEYLAGLQGGLTPQQQKQLDELKRQVQEIRDFKPGQKVPSLLPVPGAYLLDLQGYNPALLAQSLTMPMLILQGERDYQVSMRDFALWKAALGGRPNVTLRSYAKLNHLFTAGEGKSTPAEYESGHVDGPVVEDISHWILAGKL